MLKVMLVDDEPYIVEGLKVLIDWEKENFEIVKVAENGIEALEYLKDNTVDLIIADIKMPLMTGIELLEKIKTEGVSDAYFVILSGYNDFQYARESMRLGCMDYLLKPIKKDELVQILRKISALSKENEVIEQHHKETETAFLQRHLIALIVGRYDELVELVIYVLERLVTLELQATLTYPCPASSTFTLISYQAFDKFGLFTLCLFEKFVPDLVAL